VWGLVLGLALVTVWLEDPLRVNVDASLGVPLGVVGGVILGVTVGVFLGVTRGDLLGMLTGYSIDCSLVVFIFATFFFLRSLPFSEHTCPSDRS